MELDKAFNENYYLFRRKVFKIFGGAFHVYNKDGELMFYSKQKAFKLREDITIYSDDTMRRPLLLIKTPNIIDFSARYAIMDATDKNKVVGSVQRRGFRSIIRDEWTFFSRSGEEVGKLREKSIFSALVSRYLNLIPQTYKIFDLNENEVAQVKQHFNPFVFKNSMFIHEKDPAIDRRLLVAAGILLLAIEGRQEN